MYTEFAELLNEYLHQCDRSQAWLAQQLRVNPATVSRWITDGRRPKSPALVAAMLAIFGENDRYAQARFYRAAGHPYPPPGSEPQTDDAIVDSIAQVLAAPTAPHVQPVPTQQAGIDKQCAENGDDDSEALKPMATNSNAQPARPEDDAPAWAPASGVGYARESLRLWLNDIFDWNGAPVHSRSGWEGRLLYALGRVGEGIKPSWVLWSVVALLLWGLTLALLGPVMAWPHGDVAVRQRVCFQLGLALLLVPLIIGLVTQPEGRPLFAGARPATRARLLFLQLAGAYMGFLVFALLGLGLSLGGFYLTNRPLPALLVALLCALPLLFGYVAARRIPLDRYAMFSALRIHSADRIALLAALLFGFFTPLFLCLSHDLLVDRRLGGPALLLAIGLAAWRERRRSEL